MFCGTHPQRIAITRCVRCGRGLCTECQINDHGQMFCSGCVGLGWGKKQIARSPAIPTFLSALLPGMGQVYNGEVAKGLVIFFTAWLIIPWIYGIIDAYIIAQKINRGEIPSRASLGNFFGCLFLLIMLIASPFVLGKTAKKYIFSVQIMLNERATQQILHQIAQAAETYNNIHKRYADNYSDLYFHKPPLIHELYCDVPYNGYVFSCIFSEKGYTVKAVPTSDDMGIKSSYLMTTGENLTVLKEAAVADVGSFLLKKVSFPNATQTLTDQLQTFSDEMQNAVGNLPR